MPASPSGCVLSVRLPAEDAHLLDLLRERARVGDRTLSRETVRTLREALLDERNPGTTPGSAATTTPASEGPTRVSAT